MPLEEPRRFVIDLGPQNAIALQNDLTHRPRGASLRIIGVRGHDPSGGEDNTGVRSRRHQARTRNACGVVRRDEKEDETRCTEDVAEE